MKTQEEAAAPQALKEEFEKYSGSPMTGGPLLFLQEVFMGRKSIKEQILEVLRKYFEGNEEYDPNFSAQDALDEISAIVDY